MSIAQVLEALDIVVWPVVLIIMTYSAKPLLKEMFSGAKVKLSIAGQTIETTLPEIQQLIEEQAGDFLNEQHKKYLRDLLDNGPKLYSSGVTNGNEREFLRPLRNSGLIVTIPRNSFLSATKGVDLSGLGRLYMRI